MSRTYAQRKQAGKRCLTLWIDEKVVEALGELATKANMSRASFLEKLLTRESKMSSLLDATKAKARTPKPQTKPVPRITRMTDALYGDEDDDSPGEVRVPEGARSAVDPDSPAAIARRVLEKQGRREATIVKSGRRVREGREVR